MRQHLYPVSREHYPQNDLSCHWQFYLKVPNSNHTKNLKLPQSSKLKPPKKIRKIIYHVTGSSTSKFQTQNHKKYFPKLPQIKKETIRKIIYNVTGSSTSNHHQVPWVWVKTVKYDYAPCKGGYENMKYDQREKRA